MRSGQYIKQISQAYRVDEATVATVFRFLREAGLQTSGARGVNAPHMIPLDAARLTIALLSTDSPARAVERLRRFGAMPFRPDESTAPHVDHPCLQGDGVTFETALARLMTYSRQADCLPGSPYIEVWENAKKATIQFDGFTGPVAVFRDHLDDDRFELSGIRKARGLAAAELLQVAVSLWADA